MAEPARGPRRLLLLTNDDGVRARGPRLLRQAALAVSDVVIGAPTREQSAQSYAITLDRPLRHIEHEKDVHSTDGTPADCVYLALYEGRFLPRQPDIVLSGSNVEYNLVTSVFYSGTMAAAREAVLRGIPALAFSARPEVDRAPLQTIATDLTRAFAQSALHAATTPLLNVNFPNGPCQGARVTRVGRQVYDESVIPRIDPNGCEPHGPCCAAYFSRGGRVTESREPEGTDAHAVMLGYVSVTPLALDSTNAEHWETAGQVVNVLSHEGDKS
jgi:5'-nucleotidase